MSTFYNRPGGLVRASNGLFGWLAAHGIGPGKTVQLEVKGRKTGEPRRVAVNIIKVDGQRYLVAPRGNTEWVRNVRVAGEAVIRRRKPETVSLMELPENERAPIIQAYLRDNAIVTKREFGIDPKSPLEEFEKIAAKHPVFRITPKSG